MNEISPLSVLFVCLGNICRSPTAHGVFEHLVHEQQLQGSIAVDSCGTGDWHIGSPPDARATAEALKRGYKLSELRARQLRPEDFDQFDYILAMDDVNHRQLSRWCPDGQEERLHLFLDFSDSHKGADVPDPYYGGENGFEDVLDLIEAGAMGLLGHIRENDF